MTEAEKKALAAKTAAEEQAKALVAGAVSEAIAPMMKGIGELVEVLKAQATAQAQVKATDNLGDPTAATRPAITGKQVEVPAGIKAARVIKAQLAAKLGGSNDVEGKLKAWGYHEEAAMFSREKAMTQNVFAEGGALVPAEYSSELIALLRNKTAVRQLGARAIPMGASLEMPSQDQAATAYYVGEGVAITVSEQKVGSMKLSEKKLAGLVVISNDLIRNAVIAAEEFVRDDLVQVLALKEDYTAIFGTGGEYTPRGLVSLIDASHQYAATAATPQTPTLAEVRKELAKAKRKLKTANIPMVKLGWIMSPRIEETLYAITDGNGNAVYAAALDNGMLHGAPVVVTNQVPENLGGTTDESRLIFGDWSQFLIGESMAPSIEVFPNAAYDSSGTVKSGISQDQSVVRALAKHDFNTRYSKSHVIVALRWGA